MEIIVYLLVGGVAGFLSGLLGIGGGVVVVPFLSWIFLYSAIPQEYVMHMAIGTSLMTMVITSIAAIVSHQMHRNIEWRLCWKLIPGSIIGVIFGAWIASRLDTRILSILFAILLLIIALYIFFSARRTLEKSLTFHWVLFLVCGLGVGVCSGLLGIGGGTLLIPLLLLIRLPVNHVAGTSVAIVFPLAIVGAITFMVTGSVEGVALPESTGFIYWPALIGVGIGSIVTVHLGTWVGGRSNTALLKRCFAVLLLLIALQLIFFG